MQKKQLTNVKRWALFGSLVAAVAALTTAALSWRRGRAVAPQVTPPLLPPEHPDAQAVTRMEGEGGLVAILAPLPLGLGARLAAWLDPRKAATS